MVRSRRDDAHLRLILPKWLCIWLEVFRVRFGVSDVLIDFYVKISLFHYFPEIKFNIYYSIPYL